MPTAKARYAGDGTGTLIQDFTKALQEKLRRYYPDQQAEADLTFGHPADAFVNHVLAEARWAVSELKWHGLESTRGNLRAELLNLLSGLQALRNKLRNLSPDVDRLLGIDADPLGCADNIEELIGHVEDASQLINKLPTAKKSVEKEHGIAVELAIRVLRVLKEYGIAPAATGNAYFSYTSDAVKILKAIGDDIGLERSPLTWRDTIIKAKQAAPDLQ